MGKIIPNENSWIGFAPNLTGAVLAAPVQSALATATTGGTITSGTYYYKVTALQSTGETVGSNEMSIVVPATTATNSNTVTWAAVSGATGYKVYRGITAGGENRLVTTIGSGATVTYTDTGAATTAGTPPVVNTTGRVAGVANTALPSTAEIANAVDLTGFVISITAQTTGNTVPTPTLKTKFETSIQGTYGASLTADFYRDDQSDTAWAVLPRNTQGYIIISRFGGRSPVNPGMPISGDQVEVWPIIVVARSASNLASNTAEMFTMTASVPTPPVESAVVV
jgi:hypothetical protein